MDLDLELSDFGQVIDGSLDGSDGGVGVFG